MLGLVKHRCSRVAISATHPHDLMLSRHQISIVILRPCCKHLIITNHLHASCQCPIYPQESMLLCRPILRLNESQCLLSLHILAPLLHILRSR